MIKNSWKNGPEAEKLSPADIIAVVLCSGLGFIAGIVWLIQRKPKGLKMLAISFAMVVPQMIFWFVVNMVIVAMQPLRRGGF
jgi:thiamine transporter ThiT